jgi:hypothetical protein
MHDAERKQIQTILKTLRKNFPKGTPDLEILSAVLSDGDECNPDGVARFARSVKRFTTADVMNHFQVGKYKVAGSLAALTRAGKIERVESSDPSGYSSYRWADA